MKLEGYVRSSHGSLEALAFQSTGKESVRYVVRWAPRSTEFRAVEGGAEMMSGETLLVEAYAALWIILLGHLLVSWRRQSPLDAGVNELERGLSPGSSEVTPGHRHLHPGVLLVGLALGYVMGGSGPKELEKARERLWQ